MKIEKKKNETKIISFLFFTKICIVIISIIIISLRIRVKIIYKEFLGQMIKILFSDSKRNNKAKRFTLDVKKFVNNIFTDLDEKINTLTENILFLQYKKEVQTKDEQFETNEFITVDFVKKIIENQKKVINNTYNKINDDINIKNNLYNYDNNYKIYKYVYETRKEPLSIHNLKKFNISFNPKISVIIPSHNCEKYLKNIQRSIQDQSFEDIEIIYVDDCSTDKTSEIIKSFQEIDHRIVYVKNKVNKGLFYSRNKGALFARGKYIQFVDADDMLVNNILEKTINIAEDKKVDVVQYALILVRQSFSLINEKYSNKSLFLQPELSDEMFYGKGYLTQANHYIVNKLLYYSYLRILFKNEVIIVVININMVCSLYFFNLFFG